MDRLSRLDNADEIPFDLKDQCVREICGEPDQTQTPSDLDRADLPQLPGVENFFAEAIQPSLEKSVAINVERKQKLVAKLEEAIPRLSSVQLPQSYVAILNLFWVFTKQEPREFLTGSQGRYTINDDALKNALPSMPDQEREFLKTATLDLYNSSESIMISALTKMSFADFLKIISPDMTLQAAETAFAENLLGSIRELQASFPAFNIKVPPALYLLQQGKDLAPESLSELTSAFMFHYVQRTLTEKLDFLSQRHIPTTKIIADALASGVIDKIKSQTQNRAGLSSQKDKMLETCERNLNQSLLAAPQDHDIENIQRLIVPIKKSVIKVAQRLSPDPDVQNLLLAAVENLAFNFPFTAEEILPSMKTRAENEVQTEAAKLDALNQADDTGLFLLLATSSEIETEDLFESVGSACKTFLPPPISDAAVSALGKVNVSWQTLKYPTYGIGILSHEMGHIVSHVLQKANAAQSEAYSTARTCTANRHTSFDDIHGSIYVEEDFADLIAGETLNDLRTQGLNEFLGSNGSLNYGCLLLGNDGSRWGTVSGLAVKTLEADTDGHSAPLLRTLQLQTALEGKVGTLPKSCQALATKYTPSVAQTCAN